MLTTCSGNEFPIDWSRVSPAPPLTGELDEPDCGFELGTDISDEPLLDPCGPDAELLAGPVTLSPAPSVPALDRATLELPDDGFICLTILATGVASARVTLDGEPLLGSSDFNARVRELRRVARVEAPRAVLDFEIRARPGSEFVYEVGFVPLDPLPRGAIVGENERLTVQNLTDQPDPFSPGNPDGIRDTVELSILAVAAADGISIRSANTHAFRALFQITSPDNCEQIVALETQVILGEGTPRNRDGDFVVSLSTDWDGRDELGEVVPGGTYFYRAVVDLGRESRGGRLKLLDRAVSEILSVSNDDVPPEITMTPANGDLLAIDIPRIGIAYTDEGAGVAPETLVVLLNGEDVTARFTIGPDLAIWQVAYEAVLPEGINVLDVSVSDRAGNVGEAQSVFVVATPTAVLLTDLRAGSDAAADRAAAKLIARSEELTRVDLRAALTHAASRQVVTARDAVLSALRDSRLGYLERAIAARAAGEIAQVDPVSRETTVAVAPLTDALFNDSSWLVKAAAADALGLTGHPDALSALQQYTELSLPSGLSDQDQFGFAATQLVALRSIVTLSGDSSLPNNPPTWFERRDAAIDQLAAAIGELIR